MTTQTKTRLRRGFGGQATWRKARPPQNWRRVKLGEVLKKVIDNRGKTPPLSKSGYPMIEVFQLSRSRKYPDMSDIKKQKFVSENTYKTWFRSGHPRGGDILMSTVGTIAQWDLMPQNEQYCIAQNVVALRPDLSKTTPEFLRLYFNQKKFVFQVEGIVIGATQPSVRLPHFLSLEIEIPPLNTQKRIADILSAFDDKIELNNKISKNLEAAAQAIFKEWFVNFRFPGHEKAKMIDSELGKIPDGWEVKNVMEIIKRLPVGRRYDNKTALSKGKVPILDQGQSGIIGFHNEEASVSASTKNPVAVFSNHSCYYRLVTYNFSCIQNVIPYVGINGYPTLFVYYLTKDKVKMSDYKGHWPEFSAQKFIVPPKELAVKFGEKIQPFIEFISKIQNENQKLATLRDLLLPKLMSGERRV